MHLKEIELRELDRKAVLGFPGANERLKHQAMEGCAYTGIDDSCEIIIIGGVVEIWEGVGAAWLLTSSLLPKNKIWAHRAIRDILCDAIETYNLHRVETLVLEDHLVSQRWISRLGFQQEGLFRKYDSDQNNHYMFARIEG